MVKKIRPIVFYNVKTKKRVKSTDYVISKTKNGRKIAKSKSKQGFMMTKFLANDFKRYL